MAKEQGDKMEGAKKPLNYTEGSTSRMHDNLSASLRYLTPDLIPLKATFDSEKLGCR